MNKVLGAIAAVLIFSALIDAVVIFGLLVIGAFVLIKGIGGWFIENGTSWGRAKRIARLTLQGRYVENPFCVLMKIIESEDLRITDLHRRFARFRIQTMGYTYVDPPTKRLKVIK